MRSIFDFQETLNITENLRTSLFPAVAGTIVARIKIPE